MISTNTLRGALFVSAAAIATILPTGSAHATQGYFSAGYGTTSKGMAGSGQTAVGLDTQAAATNPASMRDVGTRAEGGLAFFMPKRQVTDTVGDNAGGDRLAEGQTAESSNNIFLVPSFGYNRDLDSISSIGLSVYGNGGMNTTYNTAVFNGEGIGTGIDLAQLFVGLTYAKDINSKLSVGITPRIAVQRFQAKGMDDYDRAAHTDYVGFVTDNGYDWSYGYGASVGATYKVSDTVSVGAAYSSRTYMTEFDKYKGLFAQQGDFDVPSSYNLGVSFKANDKLTVTADYQRINYGEVEAVANPIISPAKLGADGGTGFGWRDLDVIKLGASYKYSPELMLRAGISHNNQNPYPSGEYLFNIIAPGVIRTHVSAGATYQTEPNSAMSFALTHALKETTTGEHSADYGGGNGTHQMYQWEAEVTYSWFF